MCARRTWHADGIERAFGHVRGRLDQAPRFLVAENLGRQLRMQGVARAMGDDMTDDRISDERQVTNDVQDLVTHELIFEAQGVQHAGVADDDGVFERAAERQALQEQLRTQRLGLSPVGLELEVERLSKH